MISVASVLGTLLGINGVQSRNQDFGLKCAAYSCDPLPDSFLRKFAGSITATGKAMREYWPGVQTLLWKLTAFVKKAHDGPAFAANSSAAQ